MDNLLLHPITRQQLDQIIQNRPHAIMLIAPLGSGKLAVAQAIATEILELSSPEKLIKYPYFSHIRSEGSVSIEQIRSLQGFLQLKTTGKQPVRRIVIIEDAHTMTLEAQNALLKVLEEPPKDTCLILTVQGERSLKPTIYSRVQRIGVKSPSLNQSSEYFGAKGYHAKEIQRAYLMADGGMGIVSMLLTDQDEHPLKTHIALAKELIAAPTYERLLRADELSKDKAQLPNLLFALKRVSTAALVAAAQAGQQKQLERWHRVLRSIFNAEASLSANPNPKLLLTSLFLHL